MRNASFRNGDWYVNDGGDWRRMTEEELHEFATALVEPHRRTLVWAQYVESVVDADSPVN